MKDLLVKSSIAGLFLIFMAGCSSNPLEGTWQYDGGKYNGKAQKASPDFAMQRTYTSDTYEAFLLEGEAPPELYSSGIFEIKADSLLITSKFSSQPSQNTDITIPYKYSIDNGRLTTSGVLPNGMVVEEYWKKVK
ncbi:MAG: hypothetical protein WKF68_08835 [Daejeonella sp.]